MNNCIICFKNKNDMIELTCNHEFCFKCLKTGVSTYNLEKCPLCRQKCKPQELLCIYGYRPLTESEEKEMEKKRKEEEEKKSG